MPLKWAGLFRQTRVGAVQGVVDRTGGRHPETRTGGHVVLSDNPILRPVEKGRRTKDELGTQPSGGWGGI